MNPPEPWYIRVKGGFLKFWRSKNPRVAAVRDIAVAGGIVLLLLASIWVYTGQPFPSQAPLVVVESGSMMHGRCPSGEQRNCDSAISAKDPSGGRVGTIDPGDLVLVKDVDGYGDVETAFGGGDRSGYGGHGDVIVYKKEERYGAAPSSGTPIIHRAMLLIEVADGCQPLHADPARACVFRIPETCNVQLFATFVEEGPNWQEYCAGSSAPIRLRLHRGDLHLELQAFPCEGGSCPNEFHSGFITKGDNNLGFDQSRSSQPITCCPVDLAHVVGKARGEIPWFGLIKLALYGNANYACGKDQPCSDPTMGPQWRVLNAVAPRDLWIGLFIAVALLIAIPIGVDLLVHEVRKRRGKSGSKPPQTP